MGHTPCPHHCPRPGRGRSSLLEALAVGVVVVAVLALGSRAVLGADAALSVAIASVWAVVWPVLVGLVVAGVAGFVVFRVVTAPARRKTAEVAERIRAGSSPLRPAVQAADYAPRGAIPMPAATALPAGTAPETGRIEGAPAWNRAGSDRSRDPEFVRR